MNALFASFIAVFAKFPDDLKVLVVMMALDYLSGVIVGIKDRRVNSKTGFIGIGKKLMIGVIVGLCAMVDRYIGAELFMKVSICFYIANEGISILENAVKIGVPVPDKIIEFLEQMREEPEKGEDENGLGTGNTNSSGTGRSKTENPGTGTDHGRSNPGSR